MRRRRIAILVLVLAGCAGPRDPVPEARYDFGMAGSPATANTLPVSLSIAQVAAPQWLETPALEYRLAYDDAGRVRTYANSRWVGPPAQLLTERLRHAAAEASARGAVRDTDAVKTEYLLRVELEEFSQVFDTSEASRAVVRARASLVAREGRTLVAQKSFLMEKPAATADAEGGVRALAAAGDELVRALLEWSAQVLSGR